MELWASIAFALAGVSTAGAGGVVGCMTTGSAGCTTGWGTTGVSSFVAAAVPLSAVLPVAVLPAVAPLSVVLPAAVPLSAFPLWTVLPAAVLPAVEWKSFPAPVQ